MGYRGRCWNPGYRRFDGWRTAGTLEGMIDRLLQKELPETLGWPSQWPESGLWQVEREIDPVTWRYVTELTVTIMTDPLRVVVVRHPGGVSDLPMAEAIQRAMQQHVELLAGGWKPMGGGLWVAR